jgi:hypothetical protein
MRQSTKVQRMRKHYIYINYILSVYSYNTYSMKYFLLYIDYIFCTSVLKLKIDKLE